MKNYTQEQLESSRPNDTALTCVDFCLRQLYADQKTEITSEVVENLTFEELLGALLSARDELQEIENNLFE
jgi:hypothetical protein